jgi:hypothetical protein
LTDFKIAVFQLIERGKLSLDTVAETILPELKDPTPLEENAAPGFTLNQLETKITIHHLLTHTAGIFVNLDDGRPESFHIPLMYTGPHDPSNLVGHFFEMLKVFSPTIFFVKEENADHIQGQISKGSVEV